MANLTKDLRGIKKLLEASGLSPRLMKNMAAEGMIIAGPRLAVAMEPIAGAGMVLTSFLCHLKPTPDMSHQRFCSEPICLPEVCEIPDRCPGEVPGCAVVEIKEAGEPNNVFFFVPGVSWGTLAESLAHFPWSDVEQEVSMYELMKFPALIDALRRFG